MSAAETYGGQGANNDPGPRQALRDALAGLFENKDGGQLPSVRNLGYRLRTQRGAIVGGLTLQRAGETRDSAIRWRVARTGT